MAARVALERQVCEPAAVHLQAAGRRFLAAVLMRRLREEEEVRTAALRLQTSGRRFLAAVLTRRLRNEEEERTERTFQIGAANSIRRAALAFVLRIRFAMAKRSATAIQAMARRMRAVALAQAGTQALRYTSGCYFRRHRTSHKLTRSRTTSR